MRLFNIQHRRRATCLLDYRVPPSFYIYLPFVYFLQTLTTRLMIFLRTIKTHAAYVYVFLSWENEVSTRPKHCANIIISASEKLFSKWFLSLFSLFFFFIKRELMDCFFDGNRTIRAIEGVVSEQSECICTRDFALPACRPMIRGGNIPIPRYMASSRELLSLIPSVYIVPHSTNLVYTNACFSFSLFFFPFLFSFFLSFF